jgi:hypothetical protein
MSFFDHIKSTYGPSLTENSKRPGSATNKTSSYSRVALKEEKPMIDDEAEWGCGDPAGMPGISLVSGFSDNVMQAIEKDLTNMNLDDSEMTNSEAGDVGKHWSDS